MQDYSIDLHQHRFSAWAAARAAPAKGRRFSVKKCVSWLEKSGIGEGFSFEKLPSAEQFDEAHKVWRQSLIEQAAKLSDFSLSHGQAAKILNCYFKARFINAQTAQAETVRAIHPPIDRLLLREMISKAIVSPDGKHTLRAAHDKGWSAWSERDYESVIAVIKQVAGSGPLWQVECYWQGYQ